MCHNIKHILDLNIQCILRYNLSDIDHGSTCGSLDDCLVYNSIEGFNYAKYATS